MRVGGHLKNTAILIATALVALTTGVAWEIHAQASTVLCEAEGGLAVFHKLQIDNIQGPKKALKLSFSDPLAQNIFYGKLDVAQNPGKTAWTVSNGIDNHFEFSFSTRDYQALIRHRSRRIFMTLEYGWLEKPSDIVGRAVYDCHEKLN